VVRTTSKLQARTLQDVEAHCELCDLPLEGQAPERSRLCYGCIRTMG
jgi:cytoplasmic tRNA 2-thiolation protein 2